MCRSPRPDDQFSPKLDGSLGGVSGTGGVGGVGGAGEEHEGYSSASPSPRARRRESDPWADLDDHLRSASQPRTMSRDELARGTSGGGGGTVGNGGRRAADFVRSKGGSGGGGSSRDIGGYSASPRLSSHMDVYASGGGGGGSASDPRHLQRGLQQQHPHQHPHHHHHPHHQHHQQHPPPLPTEAFSLLDAPAAGSSTGGGGGSSRRPQSLPLSGSRAGGVQGLLQWDSRGGGGGGSGGGGALGPPSSRGSSSSGRVSPVMEMAWLQEIERRRREAGGRSLAEAERGGGGGGARERDQERMAVAQQQQERPRSMHHLDRRQLLNEQVGDVLVPWILFVTYLSIILFVHFVLCFSMMIFNFSFLVRSVCAMDFGCIYWWATLLLYFLGSCEVCASR